MMSGKVGVEPRRLSKELESKKVYWVKRTV